MPGEDACSFTAMPPYRFSYAMTINERQYSMSANKGTTILANKDWTLLVLALAEGSAMTAAQIQKSLFLVQFEKPENAANGPRYDFVPHRHGPYAPQVNIHAYDLVMEHYAHAAHDQKSGTRYNITTAGAQRAAELRLNADRNMISHAQNVVSWVRATSLDIVVREIGREFPQYRASATPNSAAELRPAH